MNRQARTGDVMGQFAAAIVVAGIMVGGMASPAAGQDSPWRKQETPKETKPKEDKPEQTSEPAKPRRERKSRDPQATLPTPEQRERMEREAEGLFGPGKTAPAGAAQNGPAGWTLVLASFRGEERDASAQVMLKRVREEGGLPDATLITRSEASLVVLGDFPSADDATAQSELKRVQQLAVNGTMPYRFAFLAPPMSGDHSGTMPQYNLGNVIKSLPEEEAKHAIYTLQIGVYGQLDNQEPDAATLAEFRKAAEQAVVKLRQEGEQAYYYHARTRSMVTIGVFGLDDFDPQVPNYKSARLVALQKRFPNNLFNGQGIKQRVGPQRAARLQPSGLVAIPNQ